MIRLDVEQRSDEWFRARAGVATASSFDQVLTPTGKASSQADAYANKLVAECLTGYPAQTETSAWMQRGVELEDEARDYYAFDQGVDVETVGLLLRDDRRVGCSPDGLVGTDGMVEIKVPAPHTHVEYLLAGDLPAKYRPQVQGQLYVAERQWCDFISYHPDMPPLIVRVERDEAYIASLAEALEKLTGTMDQRLADLSERGILPKGDS